MGGGGGGSSETGGRKKASRKVMESERFPGSSMEGQRGSPRGEKKDWKKLEGHLKLQKRRKRALRARKEP